MSIEEADRKANTELGLPPQTRSLTEIRREITTLIKSNAVNMVQKTIDQVNEGHYAAMKYLFEAIGLFPAPMQEETPAEDSLARTLLLRLGCQKSRCRKVISRKVANRSPQHMWAMP